MQLHVQEGRRVVREVETDRRPSDYESQRTRLARDAPARSCCPCRLARLLSTYSLLRCADLLRENGKLSRWCFCAPNSSTRASSEPSRPRRSLPILPADRRGHGRTPDVRCPTTYDQMAQDTIVFLEAGQAVRRLTATTVRRRWELVGQGLGWMTIGIALTQCRSCKEQQ
jgi:hypothetical protein